MLAALMISLPRKLSFGKTVTLFTTKSCFLFTLNKKIKQLAIHKIQFLYKDAEVALFSPYNFLRNGGWEK